MEGAAGAWLVAVLVAAVTATTITASSALAASAVSCGGVPATSVGTPGPDIITGTSGPDVIHGRGGDDVIRGLDGDDIICGGGGEDILRGGGGDDLIFGGLSADEVRGGPGYDVLRGGGGADSLYGDAGGDSIWGNSGSDAMRGGRGRDACIGGPGRDDATSCNERATTNGSRLQSGESLLAGQSITSPDGSYSLTMEQNGNVVLAPAASPGFTLWDTDTTGSRGSRLAMLSDGNLAVIHRGATVWVAETEVPGAFAKIQSNANLVVLSSGEEPLWDRRSSPGVPDWQLPWRVGESWQAGAPHGTNNGSLDFGPVGGVGNVAAIASGTVGWFQCDDGGRYLQIEHGDGWMSTYYHLTEIRTELVGDWVEAGTIVGAAGNAVPCGGRSTFAHVHLVIWRASERQNADGLSIGGYTVHAGAEPYWGYWTDDATGETVVVNEDGADCCLVNDPAR